MILECKLIKNTEDGYYHGEILNIIVDDSVLSNNKIDYKKLKPITYDPINHTYIKLGEIAGKAFTHKEI